MFHRLQYGLGWVSELWGSWLWSFGIDGVPGRRVGWDGLEVVAQAAVAAEGDQAVDLRAQMSGTDGKGDHLVEIFQRADQLSAGAPRPGPLVQQLQAHRRLLLGRQMRHQFERTAEIACSFPRAEPPCRAMLPAPD